MVLTVRSSAAAQAGGTSWPRWQCHKSHSARLRAAFDRAHDEAATQEASDDRTERAWQREAGRRPKLSSLFSALAQMTRGRSRAVCMVSGRILARTVSALKAMVAGERECGRYASERRRVCMIWTAAEGNHFAYSLCMEGISAICELGGSGLVHVLGGAVV